MILSWKRLRPYILDPTPLAWDHYFRKGEPCFVLVHLKNGNYIGGRYSDESYASSYPEPQELYLSEVWRVDGEGRFVEKIESTKGVLVNNDIIEYLEFYYQGGNSDEEQQAKEPRHERVSRA